MSSPAPVSTPIDRLRARFKRLAADPRVHLLAEGRVMLAELAELLDVLEALERRVGAIERGLAALVSNPEDFTNDG